MAGKDPFKVEGLVVEVLANGTYQVALANGHRLLGFVAGRSAKSAVRFAVGEKIRLSLTPFDLSSGRILVGSKEI